MDPAGLQRALLATFFEESAEGLDRFEAGLLELETSRSRELVDELFRVVHSMKGGAGLVGLTEVACVAHVMENVLDQVRQGAAITGELIGQLLHGGDVLRQALEARRSGAPPLEGACAEACEAINSFGLPAGIVAPARARTRRWTIHLRPTPDAFVGGLDPQPLFAQLAELGATTVVALLDALPALGELEPTRCYLAWTCSIVTEASEDHLRALFSWIDDVCETIIAPAPDEEAPAEPAPAAADLAPTRGPDLPARPAAPASTGRAAAPAGAVDAHGPSSIRVGIDKIDQLINMVGELVITQSMLGEIDGDGPIDAHALARLREGLGQLARNTRALQDSVMRLRSMPIGTVFHRFPRLVRELGEKLGKEIHLELSGQATELDKAVLEKLGDPLVHLVRNAIDHGLEPVADREAAGKRAAGTIRLHAEHRGGDVVVEITDDGRGFDVPRIIATARARGLISADATVDDRAALQLVCLPGFSTAREVSELSGRGVGMDVVRRHVLELGGDLQLDSQLGRGSRVTLRLPLTLAIIDGQLIRIGDHQVVIPLLSITESVEVEAPRIARLASGVQVYRLRDQLIPMLDLAAILELPRLAAARSSMVVVTIDNAQVGFVVDELLAQQQVVVKSLEANYHRVPGLAGATILGDGQVAFILDVVALVQGARPSTLTRAA